MRFGAREGKRMFNKRLTVESRAAPYRPGRQPCSGGQTKKEPRYERLSGVNREASNRVAPTTR